MVLCNAENQKERKGKSTAIHARVLAPSDVQIYEYPNIPEFAEDTGGGEGEVLLLFPSEDAVPIEDVDPSKVNKVRRLYSTMTHHSYLFFYDSSLVPILLLHFLPSKVKKVGTTIVQHSTSTSASTSHLVYACNHASFTC